MVVTDSIRALIKCKYMHIFLRGELNLSQRLAKVFLYRSEPLDEIASFGIFLYK